jgi:hypothetical protein
MEIVSVEKAMKKAWATRIYTILVFFTTFFIPIIFFAIGDFKWYFFILAIIISFILTYLYSNYVTQKWRIWAFTHVRNVYELRNYARQDMFISRGRGLFEKLEYNSVNYREKWEELQNKFKEKDEIQEDLALPNSIEIQTDYLKYIFTTYLSMLAIFGFFAIVILIKEQNSFAIFCSLLILLISYLMCYKELRILFSNNSLYIDIDNLVVDSKSTYEWIKISSETIIPYYEGRQRVQALRFTYEQETVIVKLNKYKVNKYKLIDIIRTFRIRKQKTATNMGLPKLGHKC